MARAGRNEVALPDHLQKALSLMEGDDTATTVFLAEALKPKDTGKHTSTREMTQTGVWSERDITRSFGGDRP
jgi:creatinine amidohydrolase